MISGSGILLSLSTPFGEGYSRGYLDGLIALNESTDSAASSDGS